MIKLIYELNVLHGDSVGVTFFPMALSFFMIHLQRNQFYQLNDQRLLSFADLQRYYSSLPKIDVLCEKNVCPLGYLHLPHVISFVLGANMCLFFKFFFFWCSFFFLVKILIFKFARH